MCVYVTQDELQALEAEQADVVALKDAALKALDGTRDETNASMSDFRENRKFSLSVRDLVAASRTDEAAALVRAQVRPCGCCLRGARTPSKALRTTHDRTEAL